MLSRKEGIISMAKVRQKLNAIQPKKGPPTLSKDPAENFRIITETKLKKIERLVLSIGNLTTARYASTAEQHNEIKERLIAMVETMARDLQKPRKEKLPRGIRPDVMSDETLRLSLQKLQEEIAKRERERTGVKV